MKKRIFITLFCLANFALSQTLTPEICWSFDGTNTHLKEIQLLQEALPYIWAQSLAPQTIRWGMAEIDAPLALIDDNQRWIVIPKSFSEDSYYYDRLGNFIPKPNAYEIEKRQAISDGQLLFLLSLHKTSTTQAIESPNQMLKVDSDMAHFFFIGIEANDINQVLSAYQHLPNTTSHPYPSKTERVGTFMLSYIALSDSFNQVRAMEMMREDSIAAAQAEAEFKAMIVADSMVEAQQQAHINQSHTQVKWSENSFRFKNIHYGEKISHTFRIKNTGKNDLFLLINDTDLESPISVDYCEYEAIKPGESCEIRVFFDTEIRERTGDFTYSFPVKGNFEGNEKTLKVMGNVIGSRKAYPLMPMSAANYPPLQDEAQQKADSLPKTEVEWAEDVYDFRSVKEGESVKHNFDLRNTGKEDLYITNVKPSCGCTASYCTKEVIKPGESCSIIVEFNSAGKSGKQLKSITVTGNFKDDTQKVLKITGEVIGR